MRVVSSDPHESVTRQVVCTSCGSTLEYVPLDVTSAVYKDYGGGSDTYYHVICPNCSNKVEVGNPAIRKRN